MASHTPGPWYLNGAWNIYGKDLEPTERRANGELIPELPRCVAHVIAGHGIDLDERYSNAHLIAAAPDLLAAFRFAHAHCDPTKGREAEWDRLVDAAFAKLEGRA